MRALAQEFARLDTAGTLAPLFDGPADLSANERRQVEDEECWILGLQ